MSAAFLLALSALLLFSSATSLQQNRKIWQILPACLMALTASCGYLLSRWLPILLPGKTVSCSGCSDVCYCRDLSVKTFLDTAKPGDLLILLGGGDVTQINHVYPRTQRKSSEPLDLCRISV